MAPSAHVPSLTHLRAFARARATGRMTHVARDKAQVNAPADGRIFAFVYERFLTQTLDFIHEGRRSSTLERAHENAPARMSDSYRAAARGMTQILEDLDVVGGRRRQHNIVVTDPDSGDSVVSLRLHLLLETSQGAIIATHLHFPEEALTPTERLLTETAVGLAAQQVDPSFDAALALVRKGRVGIIGEDAFAPDRIDALRAASGEYQAEWDNAD